MTAAPPVLAVDALTVHYGSRLAVDELCFELRAGEIIALLGPNGAGKSTALLAIAGGLMPSAGTISVDGIDVKSAPLDARRHIALADQPPSLYEFLSVGEHLQFIAEAYGTEVDSDSLLAKLGLAAMAGRLCRELSFGMRQRVGLAAALASKASCVLLDETLNGLDPRAALQAREVLSQTAAAGAAILMSTHLLGVAERLCHRILVMDRGRLTADLGGAELERLVAQGSGAIEKFYLAHVRPDEEQAP